MSDQPNVDIGELPDVISPEKLSEERTVAKRRAVPQEIQDAFSHNMSESPIVIYKDPENLFAIKQVSRATTLREYFHPQSVGTEEEPKFLFLSHARMQLDSYGDVDLTWKDQRSRTQVGGIKFSSQRNNLEMSLDCNASAGVMGWMTTKWRKLGEFDHLAFQARNFDVELGERPTNRNFQYFIERDTLLRSNGRNTVKIGDEIYDAEYDKGKDIITMTYSKGDHVLDVITAPWTQTAPHKEEVQDLLIPPALLNDPRSPDISLDTWRAVDLERNIFPKLDIHWQRAMPHSQ